MMVLKVARGCVRKVLTLLTSASPGPGAPCTGDRGGDWSWLLLDPGEHGSDLTLLSELMPLSASG